MFAKIFGQIFDSSIAEDYKVRHVFEDLLKLADQDGVVDMTVEAVARRTNVPLEEVRHGIEELMKPDPISRSKEYGGRRLILIDPERNWGWEIVNYKKYRDIQNEESRRAAFRDAKRKEREKKKEQEAKKQAKKKIPKATFPSDVMQKEHEFEEGEIDKDGFPVDQESEVL